MSTPTPISSSPFDPERATSIERGIARYRAILPPRGVLHFKRVAFFLLDAHPAPVRWLEALRRADPAPDAVPEVATTVSETPAASATPDAAVPEEVLVGLLDALGIHAPPSIAEVENLADLVFHEAEAGMHVVVDASFPERETAEECRRELARFVDVTFAALYMGLIAAMYRRHRENEQESARLGPQLVWAAVLFRRLDLSDREQDTFDRCFTRAIRAEEIAKRSKTSVVAEQEYILSFLERVGAFVQEEGPKMSELKVDKAKLTPQSTPWAISLLNQELLPKPRGRRKS